MADSLVVWDAFKAFICKYLTSAINTIKRATTREIEELVNRACTAERESLTLMILHGPLGFRHRQWSRRHM